jgi:hypothetical protein
VGVALLTRVFAVAVAAAVDSLVQMLSFADLWCEEIYFPSDNLSSRNRDSVLDFVRLPQNSANSRKMNSVLY